ncbi:MAG: hypothetical protein ACI3ZP_03560 [Candidatus Cryptobacteroides sp.]
MDLTDFILEHEADDTARLLLSRGKWPGIDIDKAVTAIECRKRLKAKLPEWYAVPGIEYPDRLAAEQCSSSETASYKASIVSRILGQCRLADLTGGLGVDSAAFAKLCSSVLYNEMSTERAEAARRNFSLLGRDNVKVINHIACEDSPIWDELEAFSPDIIFIDPARRSNTGSKVFLIEECSPDIIGLMGRMTGCCGKILVKLSPMADITMVVSRLENAGTKVREIHCVESGGECKELLILCDNDWDGSPGLIVFRDGNALDISELTNDSPINPTFPASGEDMMKMKYIFEPGKALAKAGAFNAICHSPSRLVKAAEHTHLYLTDREPEAGDKILHFGKLFRINEISPLNKRSIALFGKKYPDSDVSARNIKMTSDGLRSRLRSKSGGKTHIFGFRVDFNAKENGPEGTRNFIIAAERIP